MSNKSRIAVMLESGYIPVLKAAELACVHSATIYRLLDEERVPGHRIGRFRFVHAPTLADMYPEPVRQRILEGLKDA